MKCSHPQCSRGIGLVSYRRVFAKGRYCSKKCRDSYVIDRSEPSISRRGRMSALLPISTELASRRCGREVPLSDIR